MLRILFGFLLSLCMVATASAGDLKAADASRLLNKSLTELQSMEARFEQWVSDKNQVTLQHVTGSMWVQRPGQLRWDTD